MQSSSLEPAWGLGSLPAYEKEDRPVLSEVLPAHPVPLSPLSDGESEE